MKRRGNISIGPGAASLILIFVMLSMSVLAILSVMTGRYDLRLSERSIEVAQAVYELNEKAEEDFEKLDAVLADCRLQSEDDNSYLLAVSQALPEGMKLENNGGQFAVGWTLEDGARVLSCGVSIGTYEEAQAGWIRHDLTAGTEDEWN